MSKISDLQKKMTLVEGRLKLDGVYVFVEKRIDIYGTSIEEGNFKNWLNGVARPQSLKPVSRALSSKFDIKNSREQPRDDLFGGRIGVMEFGRLLQLTRRECQFYIDELYASNFRPSLPYFVGKDDARRKIKDHGGLYVMYRLDSFHGDPEKMVVTQIPISIRFAISMDFSTRKKGALFKQQQFAIRCRADVPKQNHNQEASAAFEYDGYVCMSEDVWFWYFERRGIERKSPDVMFFTTGGKNQPYYQTENL